MREFLYIVSLLLTWNIAKAAPSAELNCSQRWFTVTFNRTELDAIGRNYTLAFSGNDRWYCKLRSKDFKWLVRMASYYVNCGTKVIQDETDIVYVQTLVLTYGSNPSNSLIQRWQHIETYNLRCKKSRNLTMSSEMNVTAIAMGKVTDKVGSSNFKVYLRAYADSSFSYYRYRRNFKLGDMLYFEISFYNYHSNLGMYPQECYATSKNGTDKYYLIKDRCINQEDGMVKILTSPYELQHFRWQMEAFRYFGNSNEVYIYCNVLICIGSSGFGCTRSCGDNSTRFRREVSNINGDVEETTKTVTIRSSAFVISDEKQEKTPNNKKREKSLFYGTQGTIIIALIALLVVIVTVGVVKKVFFAPPKTTKVEMPFTQKGVECGGYVNQALEN